MWSDTTYWLMPSWPWSRMCSGVIVMTATIVAWEMTIAMRARRARG